MNGGSAIAETAKRAASDRLVNRVCCPIAFLLLVAAFSMRLDLFQSRWLNPDEFEHLHAAWCRSEGLLPYRDFFEHHTPWFYWMLLPLVKGADQNPDMAVRSVILARGLCLGLTAVMLAALVWLGKWWSALGGSRPAAMEQSTGGVLIGLVAAALLAGLPMFLDKSLEIRPDVPAALLWVCCLMFMARGMHACGERKAGSASFFLSGLCLGGAIMCTQKLLFAVPGVVLGSLTWVLFAGAAEDRVLRLRCGVCSALGGLVPLLLTWAWFAAHRAGYAFLYNNFLLNARWRAAEPPEPLLTRLAESSWPVLLLAAGGVIMICLGFVMRMARDWFGVVLLASLVSFLLGLFVIPVAFAQYLLPVLPLVALFAARFAVFVAYLMTSVARLVYLVLVLVLVQDPVSYALKCRQWTNDAQITALKYVLAQTTPKDIVMDGWRGFGVFRPHAWYYYFLHAEVRGMLPTAELNAFLDRLESGQVKPKLIVLDNNLRLLSDRFVRFVERHYEGIDHDMWLHKGQAQDALQTSEPGGAATESSAAAEHRSSEADASAVAILRRLEVRSAEAAVALEASPVEGGDGAAPIKER